MLNTILLSFLGLGFQEILVILLIVVILFGAKKIPELARGMGKGIREFKDASKEVKKEIDDAGREAPKESTTRQSEQK